MVYETKECMKNISPFRQVNRTVKTVDSYLFPVTNSDDLDLQTTSLLDLLNVPDLLKDSIISLLRSVNERCVTKWPK